MQDQYLTARQVAELLQLNVETVYSLVGNRQLPATRIGNRWRFEASEIREWFKTHRNSGSRRETPTEDA